MIISGPIRSPVERTGSIVEKNIRELIEQEQEDHEVFQFNFFLTYPFAYDCVQQNGVLFTDSDNSFPSHNITQHKIYDNGKIVQRYMHRPICKNAIISEKQKDKWISSTDSSNVSNIKTLNDDEIDTCIVEELTHNERIIVSFPKVDDSISHLSINGNLFSRAEEFKLITSDEIHGEFLMLHIKGTDFAIDNYLHSEMPHVVDEKELLDLQTRYPGFLEHRKACIILTSDPRVRFMGWKYSKNKPIVICIPSNSKNKLQYRILKEALRK